MSSISTVCMCFLKPVTSGKSERYYFNMLFIQSVEVTRL